jgi:hypothetical protein
MLVPAPGPARRAEALRVVNREGNKGAVAHWAVAAARCGVDHLGAGGAQQWGGVSADCLRSGRAAVQLCMAQAGAAGQVQQDVAGGGLAAAAVSGQRICTVTAATTGARAYHASPQPLTRCCWCGGVTCHVRRCMLDLRSEI